jgi:hypothetical protein
MNVSLERNANYIANVEDWKILLWMHVFAMQTMLNSVITFLTAESGVTFIIQPKHCPQRNSYLGEEKLQHKTWGSVLLICHATRDLDGVMSCLVWQNVTCRHTGLYGQEVYIKLGSLWPECIQYACAEWVIYEDLFFHGKYTHWILWNGYSYLSIHPFVYRPSKYYEISRYVGLEVLTAVVMNVTIFWDTVPCSQYVNRSFGGTYHL